MHQEKKTHIPQTRIFGSPQGSPMLITMLAHEPIEKLCLLIIRPVFSALTAWIVKNIVIGTILAAFRIDSLRAGIESVGVHLLALERRGRLLGVVHRECDALVPRRPRMGLVEGRGRRRRVSILVRTPTRIPGRGEMIA